MFRYRLYGTTVENELSFPELDTAFRQRSNSEKTITIEKRVFPFEKPKGRPDSFHNLNYWHSPDGSSVVIESSLAGNIRVNFSKRLIQWSPSGRKDNSPDLGQVILRGRAVGLLLPHLKPSFLLHASVVVRNNEAIAFCGLVFGGKSTLTAYFLNKGFSLLSDDIAVIQRNNSGFFVQPGVPEFRLWSNAARRLNLSKMEGKPLIAGLKKLRFPLTSETPWRFFSKPTPLKALYVLSRKKGGFGQVLIEKPRDSQNLIALLQSAYNPVLRDEKIMRQNFEMASWLTQEVPVKRLVYPSGFSHLSKVYRAVIRDLAVSS